MNWLRINSYCPVCRYDLKTREPVTAPSSPTTGGRNTTTATPPQTTSFFSDRPADDTRPTHDTTENEQNRLYDIIETTIQTLLENMGGETTTESTYTTITENNPNDDYSFFAEIITSPINPS